MDDVLLDIDQTLEIINKSRDWFYRNWHKLPFAFKVDGEIRCSSNEVQQWMLKN